jgi:hypothetical protein
MPFIAECLFCGHQLRAPDEAAGLSATCPRCGNAFTLAPMARRPSIAPLGLPLKAQQPPEAPLAVMNALPTPKILAVTGHASGDKGPTDTSLDAALTAQQQLPLLQISPAATSPESAGWLHPFGAGSFFLGTFALLWPQLGLLLFLSIPLSIGGLFLGLLGMVIYLEAPRIRLLLPGAGAALNLVVLVVMIFCPDLLVDPRRFGSAEGGNAGPGGVVVGEKHSVAKREVAPEGWVDISRDYVQCGDVQLRMPEDRRAGVQYVDLKNAQGQTLARGKYLLIPVRLSNVNGARKITYESWNAPGQTGGLRDQKDRVYPVPSLPAGAQVPGQVQSAALLPGKFVNDVLIFEAPARQVEYLRLELPAAAIGGTGQLRLLIPSSMISQ